MAEKTTCIYKRFPSKKPEVTYLHPTTPRVQYSHTPYEEERAKKAGVSVEVYRQRVAAVSRASSTCFLKVGDTVWPSAESDKEAFGQLLVLGVCRHYDDYGKTDWAEPPMILTLRSQKSPDKTLHASPNWVVRNTSSSC